MRCSMYLAITLLAGGCGSDDDAGGPCGRLPAGATCSEGPSRLLVPGACAARDDLGQLDFSLLLLDGDTALKPDTRIGGEHLGALLGPQSFTFGQAPPTARAASRERPSAWTPPARLGASGSRQRASTSSTPAASSASATPGWWC